MFANFKSTNREEQNIQYAEAYPVETINFELPWGVNTLPDNMSTGKRKMAFKWSYNYFKIKAAIHQHTNLHHCLTSPIRIELLKKIPSEINNVK